MSAVTLRQVSKRYGSTAVVQALDLEVRPGEFLTLLGPSGCGKTTTLRMIAGFVRPSSGRIFFEGIDVTDLPARQRNIGMVFQDYALFPHLNVRENIGFGLVERGVSRKQIDVRVQELVNLIRLDGLEDRLPAQLSGGQQQRVALARAIAHPPQVLLLDEPLGALDLKMREHMQTEVRRIQQELGLTAVYVTHDQTEAMTMSDRIAVMNAGRIEQLDVPQAIYREPTSKFVAEFVGKVNFLRASVESSNDHELLLRTTVGLWRSPVPTTRLAVDQAVLLAIRPENLKWGTAGASVDGVSNQLAVTVESSVFCGNVTLTTVTADDSSRWLVESHTGMEPPQPGQRTRLHIDVQKMVVLTGQ